LGQAASRPWPWTMPAREIGRWRGADSPAGCRKLAFWARERGSPPDGDRGRLNHGRAWPSTRGGRRGRVRGQRALDGAGTARRPPTGKSDARMRTRSRPSSCRRAGPASGQADDETAVLDLLVTERRRRGRGHAPRNQIHRLLAQWTPSAAHASRTRSRSAGWPPSSGTGSPTTQARSTGARRAVRGWRSGCGWRSNRWNELEKQIGEHAEAHFTPLTRLCGVNILTAGALAGILGPGRRWRTDAQLAAYAAVARWRRRRPASHATAQPRRNRRLNAILYRIALTRRATRPRPAPTSTVASRGQDHA